jgi:hypothetical protein
MTRLVSLFGGLRRYAWLVSLALLLAGGAVTVRLAVQEWDGWTRAGGARASGPPIVYAFGDLVQFEAGTPPGRIKDEIDNVLPEARRLAREQPRVLAQAKTRAPSVSDQAAAELAAIARWTERRRVEPRPDGMQPISFVYVGPKGMASRLYTRREILQVEASGELSPTAREVLEDLRRRHGFPDPIAEPFSLAVWGWLAATVLVGAPGLGWIARPIWRRLRDRRAERPPVPQAAVPSSGKALIIVSRHHPDALEELRGRLRKHPEVEIRLDRRWGERRFRRWEHSPERRRRERRQHPCPADALSARGFVVIPLGPRGAPVREAVG